MILTYSELTVSSLYIKTVSWLIKSMMHSV